LSLQDTGPFTRDPQRVKFILDPNSCKANLDKWMLESMGFIKQAMRRSNITDPRLLSVAKIARSQAGRPQVDPGGRTYYEVLKPKLDCDTKSHADGVEIVDYCFENLTPGDPGAPLVARMFDGLPADVKRRAARAEAAADRKAAEAALTKCAQMQDAANRVAAAEAAAADSAATNVALREEVSALNGGCCAALEAVAEAAETQCAELQSAVKVAEQRAVAAEQRVM
jgi:hypothetical protein